MQLLSRSSASRNRDVEQSVADVTPPLYASEAFTLAQVLDVDLTTRQRAHSSEQLRALFHKDKALERRKVSRNGLWLAVLMYWLFSATDIFLIRDVAAYTVMVRFAVGIVALAIVEFQYRSKCTADCIDITCASALAAGYIGWLVPAMTSMAVLNLSYYMVFGSIFMMGVNLFFNFTFRLAFIASAAILSAFLISLLFFKGGIEHTTSFVVFYISCFVFTSYVNRKLNIERYNVFLNSLAAKEQHREATERGQALLRLSNTDPLTGLENRRAIDRTIRAYWERWQTDKRRFAAILIDVDHFKKFNDLYGHQEGDRCLVRVSDALRRSAEKFGGVIGRYGGEEFIVIALAESEEQVKVLADNIRLAVENLTHTFTPVRDGAPLVTISAGAALTSPVTGQKVERLIHEADRALYAAKASGRNCVRVYDAEDPQCRDDGDDLASLLKIAVSKNLVSLVYQPIHNVMSGASESVEALMRLKSLDGLAVSPDEFIPIAEQTGLILELGRWLIRTVCLELLTNEQMKFVTVNISPVQLKADGFSASVATILLESGIKGSRLAFEITEGFDMNADPRILNCVAELRALGIAIWLDDFGTGFAGLSWLRLIKFDTVKIDRSFLYDADTPRGRAMLEDIVSLLRNRGYNILVEGVETEDQMQLMRELVIDQVQGFHLGRPVSADKIRAIIKSRVA